MDSEAAVAEVVAEVSEMAVECGTDRMQITLGLRCKYKHRPGTEEKAHRIASLLFSKRIHGAVALALGIKSPGWVSS